MIATGNYISIHAVLWDRDASSPPQRFAIRNFNPRGPLGPRRVLKAHVATVSEISIHAVLWDRDLSVTSRSRRNEDFNPRGPLGPRRRVLCGDLILRKISIHAVLWDRDITGARLNFKLIIFQSTRSSGTATSSSPVSQFFIFNFNPRGPLGPRRMDESQNVKFPGISIHAVLWDRDSSPPRSTAKTPKFQSTRSSGTATRSNIF